MANFDQAKKAIETLEDFCDQMNACIYCPLHEDITNGSGSTFETCKIGNPFEWGNVEE